MAMGAGNGQGGAAGSVSEINVTPLIDVLLVLLIIFMVIVPVLPKGMESAAPQPAKGAEEASVGPVMLEVHPAGAASPGGSYAGLSYLVDGQGVEPARLGQVLRALLSVRSDPAVLVSGDRRLNYDDVAQAIVVAKAAGASPIGLYNGPTR